MAERKNDLPGEPGRNRRVPSLNTCLVSSVLPSRGSWLALLEHQHPRPGFGDACKPAAAPPAPEPTTITS